MTDAKLKTQGTKLEWHPIDETPPLHTVEYAGEVWLQSTPLLLVNGAGKMAVGYCRQEAGGRPEFEVGAANGLRNVSCWAIVQPPYQD